MMHHLLSITIILCFVAAEFVRQDEEKIVCKEYRGEPLRDIDGSVFFLSQNGVRATD